MPPKKRAHSRHTNTQRPSKRTRSSDLAEIPPEAAFAPQHHRASQNLISVDLQALSASIATTVSQAVQNALGAGGARNNTQDPGPFTPLIPDSSPSVVPPMDPVEEEIAVISGPGTDSTSFPRQPFCSIAITLGARVGPKLKAKIWANEYVDFECLLSVTPSTERYSLSLAPSGTSSARPPLNLEPVHAPQKIQSLNQWLTAFNTFVAVYTERYPWDALRIMKCCEVMRDIASKPGDWLFYDYQFGYIRQSAPVSYPWDTIHWELWLRAVTNFRARPACLLTKSNHTLAAARHFQGELAGLFREGGFVVDAAFPIFASNVAHPTPPVNARIQLPHAPLSSLATNSPLRLTPYPSVR